MRICTKFFYPKAVGKIIKKLYTLFYWRAKHRESGAETNRSEITAQEFLITAKYNVTYANNIIAASIYKLSSCLAAPPPPPELFSTLMSGVLLN